MVQPVVSFHRSISLGSYGGLKSKVVENVFAKSCLLRKKQPLAEQFSKLCSKRIHRDTDSHVECTFREIWLTGSRWDLALLTWHKKQISARSLALASAPIAPKICQSQRQAMDSECPKFHPNRFAFGGVIAERVNIVQTRHKVFPILRGVIL